MCVLSLSVLILLDPCLILLLEAWESWVKRSKSVYIFRLYMSGTTFLHRIKTTDAAKLQDEYVKLVEGLQEAADAEDHYMSNPGKALFLPHCSQTLSFEVLPEDLLNEAIPGNIRKAEHFVAFLKRFIEYLKVSCRLDLEETDTSQPDFRPECVFCMLWLKHLSPSFNILKTLLILNGDLCGMSTALNPPSFILKHAYRFCAERLQSLIRTLQLNRLDEYSSLQTVASFATLVSTYEKGQFIHEVIFAVHSFIV